MSLERQLYIQKMMLDALRAKSVDPLGGNYADLGKLKFTEEQLKDYLEFVKTQKTGAIDLYPFRNTTNNLVIFMTLQEGSEYTKFTRILS